MSKRLHPLLDHARAAHRGAYRIPFEVDDEAQEVLIARIDYRADVYQP